MKERNGYVIVEASVLLPLASILILLLVYLCSYLFQGCFLTQAAYVTAFRASRFPERGEDYALSQLDGIMEGQALSFGKEERTVDISLLTVQVDLKRETPFSALGNEIPGLTASWRVLRRDPLAYIRGIRKLDEWREQDG